MVLYTDLKHVKEAFRKAGDAKNIIVILVSSDDHLGKFLNEFNEFMPRVDHVSNMCITGDHCGLTDMIAMHIHKSRKSGHKTIYAFPQDMMEEIMDCLEMDFGYSERKNVQNGSNRNKPSKVSPEAPRTSNQCTVWERQQAEDMMKNSTYTNQEIAKMLGISVRTISGWRNALKRKENAKAKKDDKKEVFLKEVAHLLPSNRKNEEELEKERDKIAFANIQRDTIVYPYEIKTDCDGNKYVVDADFAEGVRMTCQNNGIYLCENDYLRLEKILCNYQIQKKNPIIDEMSKENLDFDYRYFEALLKRNNIHFAHTLMHQMHNLMLYYKEQMQPVYNCSSAYLSVI